MNKREGSPPVVAVCDCGIGWPSRYSLKEHKRRVFCMPGSNHAPAANKPLVIPTGQQYNG